MLRHALRPSELAPSLALGNWWNHSRKPGPPHQVRARAGLAFGFLTFPADLPLAAEACRHVANMGRPADNQQIRGLHQLRRSPPYGDTLDMGVWMCLPNAVADCLATLWVLPNMLSYTMVIFILCTSTCHCGSAGSGARLPRSQPQFSLIKEGVNLLHVVATPVVEN